MKHQQYLSKDEDKLLGIVRTSRCDSVKLCRIELALSIENVLGARAAAEYLRSHQIGFDVALRVLLHPALRRYGR